MGNYTKDIKADVLPLIKAAKLLFTEKKILKIYRRIQATAITSLKISQLMAVSVSGATIVAAYSKFCIRLEVWWR